MIHIVLQYAYKMFEYVRFWSNYMIKLNKFIIFCTKQTKMS